MLSKATISGMAVKSGSYSNAYRRYRAKVRLQKRLRRKVGWRRFKNSYYGK